MVAVRILGERTGVYFDGLGEIERDAVAGGRQEALGEPKDRGVHDELASCRRTSQQATKALGPLAEEVADAIGRRGEIIIKRSEERRGGKEGVSTCKARWSPEH